jgi:site-specific DNA recombinase
MELADQRIVSDELWSQVRERMQMSQQLYGVDGMAGVRRDRAAGSPHIFTGLLVCSECGGCVTIVSGSWKKREERYGCSMHAYRGNAQCKNPLLIKKSVLEKRLLAGLQGKVLHPDVVRYTLKRFEDELTKLVHQKADSGT